MVAGCSSPLKIAEITANEAKYQGTNVTVRGTVGNEFWLALLQRGAYQLTDESGTIWIVCSQSPPAENDIVKVSGRVDKAITLGDKSLGTVIIEEKREKS